MKVAVIGGGIVGAASAQALATTGVQVHVYDAGGFGMAASHAGFAWVNGSTVIPEYLQLKLDANRAWRQLQRDLPDQQFLHLNGHIEWSTNANEVLDAYGSDGQLLDGPALSPQQRLREKVATLASDFGAELISRNDIASREPALQLPPDVQEAGWYPLEGWLQPHTAIAALLASAQRAGAELHPHTAVASIDVSASQVSGVTLANGHREAYDAVLVANGAASGSLLETIGARLPLAGTDGLTAITTPVACGLRTVVHTDELSVRPDGGGRLMIRHYSFDRLQESDTDALHAAMDELLARTRKLLPEAIDARVAEVRFGHRPIPADGLPVIGPVPGVDGVYVAVSHGAVTLAPVMAEIATRELLNGQSDDRANRFRLDRFVTSV